MEEVGALNISRKGEVSLGVDEKKLFAENNNNVHQDRMSCALRQEIWGFIFHGKCVWRWCLACVWQIQILRSKKITSRNVWSTRIRDQLLDPSQPVLLVKSLLRDRVVRHESQHIWRAVILISFRFNIGTWGEQSLVSKYSKLSC